MRRPLLAGALVLCALTATAQQASTAGNTLPTKTTAVYRSTTVTGATLVSLEYVLAGNTIVGVRATVREQSLISRSLTGLLTPKTMTPRLGNSVGACTAVVSSLVFSLLGPDQATYSCTGFTGSADRPPPLVLTVS